MTSLSFSEQDGVTETWPAYPAGHPEAQQGILTP